MVKRYKALVEERMKIRCVYLFGSYSKGTYNQDSDIDVAIVVDDLSDENFQKRAALWKLRRQVSTLIEPVMLEADEDNPLYYDIVRTGTLI